MATITHQYQPDFVTPPGYTLKETLETTGMSQKELADRMGRPIKTISEIINVKTQITPETAIQLENVLGIPATFWLSREVRYREYLAKEEEKKRLETQKDLLSELPLKDLRKRGYLSKTRDKITQVKETITYYGVNHLSQVNDVYFESTSHFRKSDKYNLNVKHLAAWIREGELEAEKINTDPYTKENFLKALENIRLLTREDPEQFHPKMIELCRNAGVAFVMVQQYEKCRTSGLARWLRPNKALIQLSLRYKTDDHFWFSFFHEAAHILFHSKKQTFLDDYKTKNGTNEIEEEANQFAANYLIPEDRYKQIIDDLPLGREKIINYAEQLNISPGILVGRLQHDKVIEYRWMNDLKRKFIWKHN
jgi:HTH-type transcriptional regulator / antitoxin HigA